MRIGGGIDRPYSNPEEWVALAKELRYSAVLCPVDSNTPAHIRNEYVQAAKEADLQIAEVGVWRNCVAKDLDERKRALDFAKAQLQLADEIGANCCVNIVGSHSPTAWDGFAAENYLPEFYDLAVDSIREIIDAVNPKNTFYTIEPMPWCVPDSPEQYLQLVKDVDRPGFGVHLDFVNMINCPEKYCLSTAFVQKCFDLLGPYIKSIHAKDVLMDSAFTTLIYEVMPGKGTLDFAKILRMAENLGPDMPVFVEHLEGFDQYKCAAQHLRTVAEQAGIQVKG